MIPGLGRFLERLVGAHFNILAWKIPWTEEPGRLQSMGLQVDMTEHEQTQNKRKLRVGIGVGAEGEV